MKTVIAIVTGVFCALVVVFLAVAVMAPSQVMEIAAEVKSVITAQTQPDNMGETPVERTPETKEEKEAKIYDLQNLMTTWTKVPRGKTEDDILWLPEIRFKVKNLSPNNINKHFRVLFMDHNNSIVGDEIVQTIGILPPGYSKDNIFFRGTIGYTNEAVFWKMVGDDSKHWRAEIFEGDSYRGPWKKIRSVTISLPKPFQQLREVIRSDAGKNGSKSNEANGVKRGKGKTQ